MIKKIGLILLLAVIVALSYFTFGHYSTGTIAGTLVKLSKKGIVFGTYEGELNTKMFIDENSSASGFENRGWLFSAVENDSLIHELETAMLDGSRVKLNYRERYFTLPWVGDTKFVVYDMEKLSSKKD